MAWLRTIVTVVSLVALLGVVYAPVSLAMLMRGDPAIATSSATAEPCAGSHGLRRCDVKALPVAAAVPEAAIASGRAAMPLAGVGPHGMWPEVEPDPPRL